MGRRDDDPYRYKPDRRSVAPKIPEGATALEMLEAIGAVSRLLARGGMGGLENPSNYCYFIQAGVDGPIKIGSAADPWWRLDALQTGNHLTLEMLAIVDDDYQNLRLEREMHRAFDRIRIAREWFEPREPILEVVRWLQERAR